MYEKFLKRFLDFILSFCGLIAFSPIVLLLVILGIIFMRGNPFFIQKRSGKNEKIFKMIKFRTMDNRKDKQGNLLPDAVRLNKYGRMLRKTSLDELPELFNILKGDMSIIGPRPLLPEYLPYYTQQEKHRHDVRPGLTGLAQVNGRSFVSWEEIFEYDLEYVKHISLKKDFQIILSTVNKVIRHKDIADISESFVGEDGKRHFIINGVDHVLHQPLNFERKENGNKTSIIGDM